MAISLNKCVLMQCLGIDCTIIHRVHMYVQHKRRVQQAKLLNFLNSFYFSAFRFYFTRVLDPHPNTDWVSSLPVDLSSLVRILARGTL